MKKIVTTLFTGLIILTTLPAQAEELELDQLPASKSAPIAQANEFEFQEVGFRRRGFSRRGFRRRGFSRRGFRRHGFRRDGFKQHGFKRRGFHRPHKFNQFEQVEKHPTPVKKHHKFKKIKLRFN